MRRRAAPRRTGELLAACPDEDGAERTACIDDVESRMTRAAAARDLLVAPANAYRRGVLAHAGDDETPQLLEVLGALAAPVARDLPGFLAAMRALGAPISIPLIPGTEVPGGS